MRGSPVLRFILLALALIATGVGLAHITSAKVAPAAAPPRTTTSAPPVATSSVPFRLALSAPAASVTLDPGGGSPLTFSGEIPLSGKIPLNPANPTIGLLIRWQAPPAPQTRHFARLTLEIPGQPTFTHVFDAPGDIDDFVELPLPASP